MTTHKTRICHGIAPLTPRLEPWMEERCADPGLHDLVEQHGSPLNFNAPAPFKRNVAALAEVGERHGVDFKVYFARKANKCLSFVDAARDEGIGVDTASVAEVEQALARGVPGEDIVCTAAIKDAELIKICAMSGVLIVADNEDELRSIQSHAFAHGESVGVALRISGFPHQGEILHSRFGFRADEVLEVVRQLGVAAGAISVRGVHFHLDGYEAAHRISALRSVLGLVPELRALGHPVEFVDMGGGFPMSYVGKDADWQRFCVHHLLSLHGARAPITCGNHPLGLAVADDSVTGKPNVYPAFQSQSGPDWLDSILTAPAADQPTSIAAALCALGLQLRCEPGRALLDGCGMTVARVVFRKRHTNGDMLVGVAMNRTQCRTSHDEFMVDPLFVAAGTRSSETEGAYLVGAYCMESEYIFKRKLKLPIDVAVGDLIAIPNTAGYFMHFLESRSHQFPLAKNLVVDAHETVVDAIDEPCNEPFVAAKTLQVAL